MKTAILITTFLSTLALFAQNADGIGINDNPILNTNEVELLNALLNDARGGFNFTDKKVAFVTGSVGRTIVSKSDYFRNSVLPWIEKGAKPQIYMVELTGDEKLRSGGYDVLVLSWVKVFTPKSQEKVIRQLGMRQ
jgi:hypothetical protein